MSESNEPDIMYHGAEWFEKYKAKLLSGALFAIIGVVVFQLYSANKAETQADSETALFAVQNLDATNLLEIAGAYKKLSSDPDRKSVAERALILSAKTWLEEGAYDKAKTAFDEYRKKHERGHWVNEAKLGQAVCQEATGETDEAIRNYISLTNSASAAIQKRATALLEAAQTKLDPLLAKPKPAPVPPVEESKPAPVPPVEESKPAPVQPAEKPKPATPAPDNK